MGIIGFITSKKVLTFLGGAVAATIGVKILKSAPVRKAAVKTMAGGMKLRDNAMSAFEGLKEDAQDLYQEARAESAEAEDDEAAEEKDEK